MTAIRSRARAWTRDVIGIGRGAESDQRHLVETMRWLLRAHDAAGAGGVARSYSLRWQRAHGRRGWLAAYPETTGYIIPTFFDYAAFSGDAEYRSRALRMAEWESEIQLESGAIQGGVIGFPVTPAIFNTGQVLFGWARAFRETGDDRFREAAQRAADFLVATQDADGAWRRCASRYARPGVNVYDARTSWGLVEAFAVTGDPSHRDAAIRNLKFVLGRQHASGWFEDCCLDDDARPLLHTLAYTMEGLLESGISLGEPVFVRAAQRAADAVLERQRPDGSLPGRFDREWQPMARWDCLTGNAQMVIVWIRLQRLTGRSHYRDAATRALQHLKGTQDLTARDGGVRGGVKGSHPVWAEYGREEYLNWAAKFLADALMLHVGAAVGRPPIAGSQ